MSARRWLVTIASFAAALAASAYVVYTSWLTERRIPTLPLTAHLLAAAAWAVEILARATKMKLGAAALRIRITFGAALRASLGGDFAAAITPARSGAEPARFVVLHEDGLATARTLLVLFTELFLEMLSLAALVVLLGLVLGASGTVTRLLAGVLGGYAVFVLGGGALALLLARRGTHRPPPRWARLLRLTGDRWRRLQHSLHQVRSGATAVRHARPGILLAAFTTSLVHVVARLLVLPAILFGLGVRVPLAPTVLWPMALLYGAALVPAPGGGGAVELGYKAALGRVIPGALLGTTVVWWRFYTFYLYIVVGALAAGSTVLRVLRERDQAPRRAHATARRGAP